MLLAPLSPSPYSTEAARGPPGPLAGSPESKLLTQGEIPNGKVNSRKSRS